MRKRSLCAGILLVFCALARPVDGISQFNDTVNYHLNVAATGNLNKTNTGSTYIFNNGIGFDINKKYVSLNSSVTYIYGRNTVIKTNDDVLAALNLDVLRSVQDFYYWGLATYGKSFSLKVDHRLQTGAGVGYKVFDDPNISLILSNGILFEATDLREVDQHGRTEYETIRNSFRLKFHYVFRDFITLDATNFLQNSFSEADDYIVKVNTSVSIRLYKGLSLTTSFIYNKLNTINTENLLLSYGLTFDRFF